MDQPIQSEFPEIELCIQENQRIVEQRKKDARREFYNSQELPYFENPSNDSEKLFNLQYKYLKNGDEAARKELYLLSYEIMRRLLWRRMKKGGMGWLDEESQNEIVGDAFWYVFRRYERGVGYVVTKSFISVLKNGVKHALEYTTLKDKEVSLTGIKNITQKAIKRFC